MKRISQDVSIRQTERDLMGELNLSKGPVSIRENYRYSSPEVDEFFKNLEISQDGEMPAPRLRMPNSAKLSVTNSVISNESQREKSLISFETTLDQIGRERLSNILG